MFSKIFSSAYSINTMLAKLRASFLPYICCFCNHHSNIKVDICISCLDLLPKFTNRCNFCKAIIVKNKFCSKCRSIKLIVNSINSIYPYKKEAKQMLYNLKYKNKLFYSNILGYVLQERLKTFYGDTNIAVIIPIPMYTQKLVERGFNQTELLLENIEKNLKILIAKDLLIQIKHTNKQAGLDSKTRQVNLSNKFILNKNSTYYKKIMLGSKINPEHYKRMILFDDVITSMATITEAATLLKKHFDISLDVWSICRS